MFKISAETTTEKVQSSTKVRHVLSGLISVAKAASILGVNSVTVTRWCEDGKLPATAKPFGKKITYKIPLRAVELLLQEQAEENPKEQRPTVKEHSKFLSPWVKAMEKGGINGKIYSPLSIADYKRHIKAYLGRNKALSVRSAQRELMDCPVEQHGKRIKYHKAMLCFAKYLLSEEVIEPSVLEGLKALRPEPNQTPRRVTVNEDELQLILDACGTELERLLIHLLASTGIRASECCAIRLRDIDLVEGILHIPIAKGGKTRKLGLMPRLVNQIQEVLASREHLTSGSALFYDFEGKPLERYGLYRLLKRIGKRAGITVHPHALRRAFVTINAGKGRPLVILQRSCGHSSIKTTMSYCQTAEQEVIEAMKGW